MLLKRKHDCSQDKGKKGSRLPSLQRTVPLRSAEPFLIRKFPTRACQYWAEHSASPSITSNSASYSNHSQTPRYYLTHLVIMPGRAGRNRHRDPFYYWNNTAHTKPEAQELAAELALEIPAGAQMTTGFKSGIVYVDLLSSPPFTICCSHQACDIPLISLELCVADLNS